MNQPPYQQYPAPIPPPGNDPPRKRLGLITVLVVAAFLGVSVLGVGGYLVFRAVTKPAHNPVTAVILQPDEPESKKDEISRRLVTMPQIEVVFRASADELPEWFPGSRPWGDIHPEAFLVKLRPGIDADPLKESIRTWPGVHMVTDVTVTDKTIGTG
ncbi:hypothetical protein AB0I81_55060 [Nonomuraea sp. NPDC050404]|uniref:hypothetical protein n=1 Tax=Nonomuraea sp. NPDC050404 TaxID=3155783 RepID=UPI0033D28F61